MRARPRAWPLAALRSRGANLLPPFGRETFAPRTKSRVPRKGRDMSLAAGTKLGPYEILSPLGAGGMGEVYRARDTRLEREVAVKVLPSHLSGEADALGPLRARGPGGGRALPSQHPGDSRLRRGGGVSYAVMELLEGETLRERLSAGACPPPSRSSTRADRTRAGRRPRTRHRPPGPEARERVPDRATDSSRSSTSGSPIRPRSRSPPPRRRRVSRKRGWSSGPRASWLRSRSGDEASTRAATSSRSERSFTRC